MKTFPRAIHLLWLIGLLAIFNLGFSVAASLFFPVTKLFAYDGQHRVRVAYDVSFASFSTYDSAVPPTFGREIKTTVEANGVYGKFAKFFAAEDATQIGYHATAPANMDSI